MIEVLKAEGWTWDAAMRMWLTPDQLTHVDEFEALNWFTRIANLRGLWTRDVHSRDGFVILGLEKP